MVNKKLEGKSKAVRAALLVDRFTSRPIGLMVIIPTILVLALTMFVAGLIGVTCIMGAWLFVIRTAKRHGE